MAKAFLLTLFTFFFIAVVGIFAYQFNMLPASVYPFAYRVAQSFPFLAPVPPSLEKFEGAWKVAFIPSKLNTDIGTCTIEGGTIRVHAGVFTGSVGVTGAPLAFSANANDEGALTGTLGSRTSSRKGTIEARLGGGQGSGVWNDEYECSGTVTFVKQESVIDPVKGRVVSADGGTLVRGGQVRPLRPDMLLYFGDTVEAKKGAVLLGMGIAFQEPIDLSPSMTYKVGQ